MLCHNKKKRQRLKEYINYKLNKYYTVIFTLIIWDFLSFFLICLMQFQILTIFISHYPPATDGSISQASEHQILKTNFVVSSHPESVMYSEKKAVLSLLYYWNMKCEYEFKPSRRCQTWGSHFSRTGVRLFQAWASTCESSHTWWIQTVNIKIFRCIKSKWTLILVVPVLHSPGFHDSW